MEQIIQEIKKLAENSLETQALTVEKLPQSGSDRIYFRLLTEERSYIATYGRNVRENDTFIYFSNHFRAVGCPVPEIIAVNEEKTAYIQEDFGDESLLNRLD